MTRWATGDLAGRLIEMLNEQHRKYRLITKKAYNPENNTMLNPKILNLEQYNNLILTIGQDIVDANYNQNPVDLKGKLYTHFNTYDINDIKTMENPNGLIEFKYIEAICDTADKGKDYLCSIVFGVTSDKKIYILDVVYTQDDMETTEKLICEQLLTYNPYIFRVESNNGGRGFSRAVEKLYRERGGGRTIFKPYTQTLNKEARILSNATEVQRNVYFPTFWSVKYKEYYNSMRDYQRQGNNEHDDAQDCTTALVERVFQTGVKFA